MKFTLPKSRKQQTVVISSVFSFVDGVCEVSEADAPAAARVLVRHYACTTDVEVPDVVPGTAPSVTTTSAPAAGTNVPAKPATKATARRKPAPAPAPSPAPIADSPADPPPPGD